MRAWGLIIAGVLVGCFSADESGTATTASDSATGSSGGSSGATSTTTSATTTTTGAMTSTSAGETGNPVCPAATSLCIDEVPAGWDGPLAVYRGPAGDRAPGCGGGYPDALETFDDELQVPQTTCACDCGTPTGVSCQPVTFDAYANNACSGAAVASGVGGQHPPNVCRQIGQTPFTTWHINPSTSGIVNPGQCNPTLTETVPPVQFAMEARSCTGAVTTAGCAGAQVCAPMLPPDFGRLCIAQDGDVACPAGAFSERLALFRAVSDDRGCGACDCNPMGTCQGELEARLGGCGGGTQLLESIPLGTCSNTSHNGVMDLWVRYVPNPGTCGPGTSTPTGQAVPANPVTYCCLP